MVKGEAGWKRVPGRAPRLWQKHNNRCQKAHVRLESFERHMDSAKLGITRLGSLWENSMKKVAALLAFSTILAVGQMAKAADIVEAPPEVYDWTGIYIGANVGYAFEGYGDQVGIQSNLGGGVIPFDELNVQGWFGGGQIGADWQAGWAVFGIVADIQFYDIDDDFNNTPSSDPDFDFIETDASSQIDWWGTFRGRLGWAWDRVLIYGTGGFAWASVEYDVFTENTINGVNAKLKDDYTATGWTAGGGLSWAIDDNWNVGGEVLYVNLGEETISGKARLADGGDPGLGEVLRTHATPDFWAARLNVNFKF
jgi:outer membrane immunogenic protein